VFDDWDTQFSAEPSPRRASLKLQMRKSIGNAAALITGEGYLADFDFSSDIDVKHSVTERVQMNYKNINGTMNFKWNIQTTQAGSLLGSARMKMRTMDAPRRTLASARRLSLRALIAHVSARAACLFLVTATAVADDLDFPVTPGVRIVLAVSNAGPPQDQQLNEHVAQGDYETIVTLGAVELQGISQTAFIDADDEAGKRIQVNVPRQVLAADLAGSRTQILGFLSSDEPILRGTTALGPSLLIMRELQESGSSTYSFRNFSKRDAASGSLTRSAGTVKFPVLINGRRTELDAVVATGQMTAGSATRPVEQYIYNHPRHPISLRIAYGPRGGGFPFKADFARDVVRIDLPVDQAAAMADALNKKCRVEVPGIYFDFDKATIKPQSEPALEQLAAVIRKLGSQHVSVEGHTDNIGGDPYNDQLAARRSAAVKSALTQGYAIQGASLSTRGFGSHRPIESNDTLAGRARNRRVELVLDCGQRR
jgi:outer membrane protein OmpA-like peptidoglycan-associated protein